MEAMRPAGRLSYFRTFNDCIGGGEGQVVVAGDISFYYGYYPEYKHKHDAFSLSS